MYVCMRCVFEEKHISLLLLPPSLFFLPADLHSRWVGLLLLSLFLSRLLAISLSIFASPPPVRCGREKFNPERALFPFYAWHRHEKLRGAPSGAQEPRRETERIY